jgi:uncharacterized protein YbcC (UPF0753/DUF2309 family)
MQRVEQPDSDTADAHESSLSRSLDDALEHAAHLLPDQAPIRVFIHHNTLHAFQHLHFHEAVKRAQEVYGAEPYLSEARFRELFAQGRITTQGLRAALKDQLPAGEEKLLLGGLLRLSTLRELAILHPIRRETVASLRWLLKERQEALRLRPDLPPDARARVLNETAAGLMEILEVGGEDALMRFGLAVTGCESLAELEDALGQTLSGARARQDLAAMLREDPEPMCVSALFTRCKELAEGYRAQHSICEQVRLPRDVIRAHTGRDPYDAIFPKIIRICGAHLDDGLATWTMPHRERGFYEATRALITSGARAPTPLARQARRDFETQAKCSASAREVVLEVLAELGIDAGHVGAFVQALLLTLPGWAGMMSRLQRHPDDRPHGGPPASLLDFLAVRLTYERAALRIAFGGQTLAIREALRGSQTSQAVPRDKPPTEAHRLFQLLSLAGIGSPALNNVSRAQAHETLRELDAFDQLTRRRVFQEAFEHHHRVQTLDALSLFRQRAYLAKPIRPARFQLISCFDDREESFRRQLEEVEPDCMTFGAPGFFGAAMRFRALDESHSVPFAPVVIKPVHEVEERPRHSDARLLEARTRRRRLWGRINQETQRGSRYLWRGIVLNLALGLLAVLPLLLRVLSPRVAGQLRRFTSRVLLPTPRTELTIHRDAASDTPDNPRGFHVDERVLRVATVLENIGLVDNFSRLIVVLGHGANTMNNPHKSAYDCGACGGRQGGPNARVFARMANDPEVRSRLIECGICIPEDCVFVGGQHDTCSEAVMIFDEARIPSSHRELYAETMAVLHEARERTARERCRRLFSAPINPSQREALAHVEARAEHLAEPRPEFGHATNAIAIIGRRGLSRGLFLDRRAFLLSYDPTIDHDGKLLERILAGSTAVGAGINLEYYFSHVDNERYGAGSKLPHNVTGLIGVMTGHASDLRTGLPRQMVEIHEPVRLLMIVEATPERLLEITTRQAEVKELVVNRWVQLVSLDPETGAMHVFTDRGFEPYAPVEMSLNSVDDSRAAYQGHHDFVAPTIIRGVKPAWAA